MLLYSVLNSKLRTHTSGLIYYSKHLKRATYKFASMGYEKDVEGISKIPKGNVAIEVVPMTRFSKLFCNVHRFYLDAKNEGRSIANICI